MNIDQSNSVPPYSGFNARDTDVMHGMAFSSIGLLPQLWTDEDRDGVALNEGGEYDMDAERDSVAQMMEMMMWRANGGCRVEDFGISTATDLIVKSDFTHIASPGVEGCKVLVDYPKRSHVGKHINALERDYNLRTEQKVDLHAYVPEALARDAGLNAGEKTGRAFIADVTYPLSNNKIGSALSSLRTLASFSSALGGDTGGLYSTFEAMWGVKIPPGGMSSIMESVGDTTVRRAMLDDKSYHAALTHYSKSGVARIHMAPMTSDSIDKVTPIPWSKLRQTARCVGILNVQSDLHLLGQWEAVGVMPNIGFEIVRRSLVSGRQSVRLNSVLSEHPIAWEEKQELIPYTHDMAMERSAVLESLYTWYQTSSERAAYVMARRAEEKRSGFDTEDELKISYLISVPHVKIDFPALPLAAAISAEDLEPSSDVTTVGGSVSGQLVATNYAGMRADVNPILSQFNTILKMLLTAECNRPKTFSAQLQLLQRLRVPPQLPPGGMKNYWSNPVVYTDRTVRSLMAEIVGRKRYSDVLRVYSLTGGSTYRQDCYNGYVRFVARCGATLSQVPIDPNEGLRYLATLQSQYVMCMWIRRACGQVAKAMSGNWFALPYSGRTLTFSRAVYDFLVSRVSYWKAFYHERSTYQGELVGRARNRRRGRNDIGAYRDIVKHQAAAATFKYIKVIRTDVAVAIQLSNRSAARVLTDLYYHRYESIAKRKIRTRPSARTVRLRGMAASDSRSWRSLIDAPKQTWRKKEPDSSAGVVEQTYKHPWGARRELTAATVTDVLLALEDLDQSLWTVGLDELWLYVRHQVEMVVREGRNAVTEQMKVLAGLSRDDVEPDDLVQLMQQRIREHPELQVPSTVALPLIQLEEVPILRPLDDGGPQDVSTTDSAALDAMMAEWGDPEEDMSWLMPSVAIMELPTEQVTQYPTLRQLFDHVFHGIPPGWRSAFRVPEEMGLDDSVSMMPAPLNVKIDKMDSIKHRLHVMLEEPQPAVYEKADVIGSEKSY